MQETTLLFALQDRLEGFQGWMDRRTRYFRLFQYIDLSTEAERGILDIAHFLKW
jgi:hypothetical protein